jgi:hypothetical protein
MHVGCAQLVDDDERIALDPQVIGNPADHALQVDRDDEGTAEAVSIRMSVKLPLWARRRCVAEDPMQPTNRRRKRSRYSPVELIQAAVRMQVGAGRRRGRDDKTIRADIKAAINEALKGDPNFAKRMMTADGRIDPVGSAVGMFRVAMDEHGFDPTDQHAQERWHQLVMREIETALVCDDPQCF